MTYHQAKHLGVQAFRRCLQIAVMAVVLGVVILSLYAHYRAARALEDNPELTGWRAKVFCRIDDCVSTMDDPQAFLDAFKGTLWSMKLGGLDWTDPLAAAEAIASTKSLYVPLLISAALPVVMTLLLGRVFCSWICPANVLFELTGKLRGLLRLVEIQPAAVPFSHKNKYMLLVVGLLTAAGLGLPIFALIYPPAVLSRFVHAWVFGTAFTGMVVILITIMVIELFVSPRWWCRTVCPGGALYAVLGWARLLRIKHDVQRCSGCLKCVPVCEPGLNPVRESAGMECDNCGVCVRHCPDQALYYTMGLPGRQPRGVGRAVSPATGSLQPYSQSTDKSVERPSSRHAAPLVALAVLCAVGLPAPAPAHHILGLPHYSYKENYPQAPTLEYPATTGPYDILLTSYPGRPVSGERANIAIYIKNRVTAEAYDHPVTIRVLQTCTFGRNRDVTAPTIVRPFDQLHKLGVTFPADGEYVVEVTIDVEGTDEVIPFLIVVGTPTATASVLTTAGIGMALFIIIVRAIKIKATRRGSPAPAIITQVSGDHGSSWL